MSDIPEEALKTIEETFGSRFVPHAADETEPHAERPFASVFPESAAEVRSLMKLAARHGIPLMARGAGTALYLGKVPRALVVRFDAMRHIQFPEESGRGVGGGRAGSHLDGTRKPSAREGYGTEGLPHERTEVHRRRLAG